MILTKVEDDISRNVIDIFARGNQEPWGALKTEQVKPRL